MLEEQVFDPNRHDRHAFRCGEPALDDFLKKYASQQAAKGICSIFVVVNNVQPSAILGFYTLSAAQVGIEQLTEVDRKKMPRYPVPCFRMGRLARATDRRGTGLGEILIGLAVDRCLAAKTHVGAYALLVDAKHEKAKAFYQNYGFISCTDAPSTLYLPIGR